MDKLDIFFALRTRMFMDGLSLEDLEILEGLSQKGVEEKLQLLVTRRAGEGELDIFCGYHKARGETKAVYLSFQPGQSVMLLDWRTLARRIKNLKQQLLPYDQSREALATWPL